MSEVIRKVATIPDGWWPGSYGPLCLALNCALVGFTFDSGRNGDGFDPDEIYGEKAATRAKSYQEISGLEPDAGIGPATRVELEGDGFHIQSIASALARCGAGPTVFVQADGSKLAWSAAPDWVADPEPGNVGAQDSFALVVPKRTPAAPTL